MVQSGTYSQEEIEKVKAQNAPSQPEKNSKKKPSAISRQDLSPCNPLIGWKTGNQTLPPNWKIKRHEYANQTVYFYMSPKGDIIKSRRAVMDYMFDDGSYSETDFNSVISGAKQRKVALQEMYDTRTGTKKKKKVRKFIPDDDTELDPVNEGSECEEGKENEEDVEGNSQDKKGLKKQIVQKEIPMPTRRSRRNASRLREEPQDDSDSEMEPEQKRIRLKQSKGKHAFSDEAVSEGSPATSITELIDSPIAISGDGEADMVDLATGLEENQAIDFDEQGVEFTDNMANAEVLQPKLEEDSLDSKEGSVDSKEEIVDETQKMEDVQDIKIKEEANLLPKMEGVGVGKTEIELV